MRLEKLFKSTSVRDELSFVMSFSLQLKLQFHLTLLLSFSCFVRKNGAPRPKLILIRCCMGILAAVSNADSTCNFLKLAVHGRGNCMLAAGSIYTHEIF